MSKPSGLQIEPSPAEKFFGLAARPFSLTPDLRFAYHSRSHTHALEQVTSALRRREGLIVVTGVIGTGKTMLCRSMLESFESRTFLSVILDPGLEVEDLLRKILNDFGILSSTELPSSGPMSEATRHQYVTALQQFLASLIPLHAHAVIMIDEAQRLSPDVLEEIRLLSNFETDEAKLLQIVLVGQPELEDLLRRPLMQQLNQRVARRCQLQPLSETEVGDYIERRLTVAASPAALAGGADAGIVDTAAVVRFSPAAVKLVATVSGGIPRLVNTLCDRALDAAYERQSRVVDADSVSDAAERLRLEVPGSLPLPHTRRLPAIGAAAAAVLAIVLIGWWWTSRSTNGPAAPSTPARVAPRDASKPSTPSLQAPRTSATSADAPAGATRESASAGTPASPAPAAPAPSGSTAATAPASAPATAPARPPALGASSASGVAAAAPSGSFQIAIAAFRTEPRAQEVASQVSAIQVPATVRQDSTGTWFRVLAGPFPSRDAAQAAQEALGRAGYTGTQISQIP